jgi:hypothetical protein
MRRRLWPPSLRKPQEQRRARIVGAENTGRSCHAQEDSDHCWRCANRRRFGLFGVRSRCWWWRRCRRRRSGCRRGWRGGWRRRNLLPGRRWTRRLKPAWSQEPDGFEFHRHFHDDGSSSHTSRQTPLAIRTAKGGGRCSIRVLRPKDPITSQRKPLRCGFFYAGSRCDQGSSKRVKQVWLRGEPGSKLTTYRGCCRTTKVRKTSISSLRYGDPSLRKMS